MIVPVSIWLLIIPSLAGGERPSAGVRMHGRTDGRKNFGGESRVANNCRGVESAFCDPAEVSIESLAYFRGLQYSNKQANAAIDRYITSAKIHP